MHKDKVRPFLDTGCTCAAIAVGRWSFIDADKWTQVVSSELVLHLHCSQLFSRWTL